MKPFFAIISLIGISAGLAFAKPIEVAHCDFSRVAAAAGQSSLPYGIERIADGWRLSFSKDGRYELDVPYSDRWRSCPEGISLYAQLLSGQAHIRLDLLSRKGRAFTTPGVDLDGGQRRMAFDTSGMASDQVWRLRRMQIDATAGTVLVLSDIMFTEERPAGEELRYSIGCGGLLMPVFNAGTISRMRVVVHNGSDERIEREVRLDFTALDRSQFSFAHPVALGPHERVALALPEAPPHHGVWYSDACSDGERLMFAYLPENGLGTPANPEFEFAVDNHWVNPSVIEAMRYLGIRAIRTIVGWERLQPHSGSRWNFQVFEDRLDALEAAGIRMRETLVFTPRWAARDNPGNVQFPRNRMPRMDAWDNYVRTMVQRYGSRVEFFELWNEPDLPGFFCNPVEDYIKLCRRAREIAREANPGCKFSSGGFSTLSPGHPDKPGAFHEAVLRDAADTFDFHSYHEHGYFDHYQQMVDGHFLPLRKKYGITAPWLASESAIHSAKGLDAAQADCLFKRLLFTWARGAFSYTWYGLCNNGYDLNYSEDNFGLMDKYMNPKYVFGVYAALIRVYNAARYAGQPRAEGAPWLFAFDVPEGMLLANWSAAADTGTAVYAAMTSGGERAEVLDLDGNAVPVPCRGGVALFPVAPTGASLHVMGARAVTSVRQAAALSLPGAIFAGADTGCVLRISNPWPEAASCAIIPEKKAGMAINGLPSEVKLSPGGNTSLPFSLRCDDAEAGELRIVLRFGQDEPVAVSAPLHFARFSPGTDFASRPPDFELKDYAQIEGNFEFDPAKTAGLWQGFNDLSARVWFGQDRENFRLLAMVRDDRHCPSPEPYMLWFGDSVQFDLGFAGQKGYFEVGASQKPDGGTANAACWIVPEGFKTDEVQSAMSCSVERQGIHTLYRFTIPLRALGVTPAALSRGFRFNLLVNDSDDGVARKCFIRLAPGIGSNLTIEHAPMALCALPPGCAPDDAATQTPPSDKKHPRDSIMEMMQFLQDNRSEELPGLPPVLGGNCQTAQQWNDFRRGEIIRLLEQQLYGRIPPRPAEVSYECDGGDADAFDGLGIRREVVIRFRNDGKEHSARVLWYLPRHSRTAAVPLVVGLNFKGNAASTDDPAVTAGDGDGARGVQAARWQIPMLLQAGYSLMMAYYGDFYPDHKDGREASIYRLFHDGGELTADHRELTAISAWAFGYRAMLELGLTDPRIDPARIWAHGHSRLGKTALWAAANERRFAGVVSNDSGCCGASLMRDGHPKSENLRAILHNFKYWFAREADSYIGRESLLPYDQHWLLALIAPRALLVASATQDIWADPFNEFRAAKAAGEAYRLFGKAGLGDAHFPMPETPCFGDGVGYYLRSGIHDVTATDWKFVIDFIESQK